MLLDVLDTLLVSEPLRVCEALGVDVADAVADTLGVRVADIDGVAVCVAVCELEEETDWVTLGVCDTVPEYASGTKAGRKRLIALIAAHAPGKAHIARSPVPVFDPVCVSLAL